MIDKNDWLLKPENYRALQQIRKRIRAIHGTDIRITSVAGVEALFQYRHDKDTTLVRMLEHLAERIPGDMITSTNSTLSRQTGTGLKMYRGQKVA